MERMDDMAPQELAQAITELLTDKKAQEVLTLAVSHLTTIADYMVICNGRSALQVRALADEVEEKLAKQQIALRRKEGMAEGRWVVLDYASVIVHIFHEQERAYYNLERLWMDGSNALPTAQA